jgi:methylated-DNA-protein-cysteine methyltransferase-like protein
MEESEIQEAVYTFVRQVPPGKVVTYGQVADSIAAVSLTPRQVGAIMRYAPEDVPWQRVIGAGGYLPIVKRSPELKLRQQELLEREGVIFLSRETGRVDMQQSQWLAQGVRTQGSLFDTE